MIKKIICLLLVVGIILGLVFFFTKCDGKLPFGNGNGFSEDNSSDFSNTAEVKSNEEEATTEIIETITVTTEDETKEEQFIDVTVSGSNYIYQNSTMTLDELMNEIKDKGLTVKLTDDKASKKAYDDILQALDENNIQHIEG